MSKDKYIAITIGPIFETMKIVSSLAALWASSYMFSYIARALRGKLLENGVENDDFITPYLSDDSVLRKHSGVGMLHDHIIFKKPQDFGFDKLKMIRREVISDVCEKFDIRDEAFLSEYVMIAAVEFDAENPILESNKLLNSLELETVFVSKETVNPLLSVFTNKLTAPDDGGSGSEGRNKAIKKAAERILGSSAEDWQLVFRSGDDLRIKDLKHIAAGSSRDDMKRHRYFAVVRCDGDNVSKIIEKLEGADRFHAFSEKCIAYCAAVSELVKKYRGVTIYAGGDDLLAILPCESDAHHLLGFVQEASTLFGDHLKDYFSSAEEGKKPSLTFAVTCCHYKYPLYEALDDSQKLLHKMKTDADNKNAVALRLIKHSGQTSTVWISNAVLVANDNGQGKNHLISLFDRAIGSSESNDLLISAFHKVKAFEKLFNIVRPEQVKDLFRNTFDAPDHADSDFLHNELPELYKTALMENKICALDEKAAKKTGNHAESLNNLMRIVKFFVEKAGEDE